MDYVLHMDADTEISPDYMRKITERMRLDNVAVTCGTDPVMPRTSPIEPGMVINVKWLNTHPTLPTYALTFLVAESAIDGYPSVVYTTIPLRYKRIVWNQLPPKRLEITRRPPENARIVVLVGIVGFSLQSQMAFSLGLHIVQGR